MTDALAIDAEALALVASLGDIAAADTAPWRGVQAIAAADVSEAVDAEDAHAIRLNAAVAAYAAVAIDAGCVLAGFNVPLAQGIDF